MSNPAVEKAPARIETTRYTLASPPTGEFFEFATSARTSPDGMFRFVWTLAPGKTGPGLHTHDEETEFFEVVSGTIRIWIDGEARDYGPGDVAVVRKGAAHRFLNPGAQPVVINVSLDGPRMEDVFLPVSVATYGREARLVDVMRMMASMGKPYASRPARAFERAMMDGLVATLKAVGLRSYPVVLGWDADGGARG
ncbi:MAG: cupin domain-containing protein [Myxococcaceae bacterium]|nr:MAG: cupin domain-containing protein [Myxococcaceae bacterium]